MVRILASVAGTRLSPGAVPAEAHREARGVVAGTLGVLAPCRGPATPSPSHADLLSSHHGGGSQMPPLRPQGSVPRTGAGLATGDSSNRWLPQSGRTTVGISHGLQCVSNEDHACCPLEVN